MVVKICNTILTILYVYRYNIKNIDACRDKVITIYAHIGRYRQVYYNRCTVARADYSTVDT